MDASAGGSGAVIATYREIADQFGLKGPHQARVKVKRAGWPAEPQNHPADPLRIRVPREAWEGAALARERGIQRRRPRGGISPGAETPRETQALPPEIPALIKALEAAHETLREELAAQREAVAHERGRAERAESEAAARREALDRAEAERDWLREELTLWTSGGALARAWRALLFRRARPP